MDYSLTFPGWNSGGSHFALGILVDTHAPHMGMFPQDKNWP